MSPRNPILGALFLSLLPGCNGSPDPATTAELRKAFDDYRAATLARDFRKVLGMLSRKYRATMMTGDSCARDLDVRKTWPAERLEAEARSFDLTVEQFGRMSPEEYHVARSLSVMKFPKDAWAIENLHWKRARLHEGRAVCTVFLAERMAEEMTVAFVKEDGAWRMDYWISASPAH
ncbi:MAG: hypothetical protein HYY17_09985 [Planctomycetes bacterium]|nr:hypothetical protein [Planctomycetota bacterium]